MQPRKDQQHYTYVYGEGGNLCLHIFLFPGTPQTYVSTCSSHSVWYIDKYFEHTVTRKPPRD